MVTEVNGKSLIPPPWEVSNSFFCILFTSSFSYFFKFGPWNQLQDEDPTKTQSQRIE